MYNIKTLRGTIFCAPIKYSNEVVKSLSGIVDGYMPMQFRDRGVLPIFPTWELTSPDGDERLIFTGDKIDLVKTVENAISAEVVKAYAERCKVVLGRIMEVWARNICTRVAWAPSVIVAREGDKPTELFGRIYNIREFEGKRIESGNISQVYRIDKDIEGKKVKVNHVANFHAESELITDGGVSRIRERYICDFDINTMLNPDNKFTAAGLNEFFEMAPECFDKFYKLYLA